MPTIAGETLTDASAADLYDASPALLGEAGISIVVGPYGILYEEGGEGGLWELLDWLRDAVQTGMAFAEILGLGPIVQSILDGVEELMIESDASLDNEADLQLSLDQLTNTDQNSVQDVLDAIAAIDAGGLTTEEHDQLFTLAPVDYEQIAGDVWGYNLVQPDAMNYDAGPMAQTVLNWVADGALLRVAYEGIPVPDRPHFRYHALDPYAAIRWLGYWTNEAATSALPQLDLTLTQQGDTVYSYLTREYPGYAWTQQGPGSWPSGGHVWLVQAANQAYFRCTLTDEQIAGIWREQQIIVQQVTLSVTTAPLWPGISDADLLTPVALADQLAIDEDMEGVIVTVTVPPEKLGRYNIGGHTLDYGVGRMTFASDRGDLEPWQYLGFRTAIYTPRTMVRAAHAYFQVLGGAGGTVTPWRTLVMG